MKAVYAVQCIVLQKTNLSFGIGGLYTTAKGIVFPLSGSAIGQLQTGQVIVLIKGHDGFAVAGFNYRFQLSLFVIIVGNGFAVGIIYKTQPPLRIVSKGLAVAIGLYNQYGLVVFVIMKLHGITAGKHFF